MRTWAPRLSALGLASWAVLLVVASCATESETPSSSVIVRPGPTGEGGSTAEGGASGGGGEQGGVSGGGNGPAGQGGEPAGQGGVSAGGAPAGSGGGGQDPGGSAGSPAGQAGNEPGGNAGNPSASLVFVSPQEGQTFQQAGSPAEALIPFSVEGSPDITRVEYRIENGDLMASKTNGPSFAHTHSFKIAGERWVEALGFGSDGAQLTSTKVSFTVKAPSLGGCLDELTSLGVPFVTTKAKGVVDAVRIQGPINGVSFTSGLKETPSGDPMACEFVKTLWAFAEIVKAEGFNRVGTLGSYCYRCCCSWSETNYCRGPDDPEPDCSANGYSNHSWGRAVDVRYLARPDGTTFDINNPAHFVAYGGSDTCGAGIAKQSGVSLSLYRIACEAHKKKVFSTILTPNHNAAHRNHFHMDTGKAGPATGAVAKLLPDPMSFVIDSGEHEDHCGP